MIKSKLIRVSHNRLFRSKIKHRNHGRRIGSSDICPDVSSSVPCPINFSYTHNTTIRGQYIDTFTPFYQPITQQNLFSNSDSETIFRDRFRRFEMRKRQGRDLPFIMSAETHIATPGPAERSDGNGSDTQKKKPEYSGIATPPFYGRTRGSMTARISKC